MIIIPVKSPEKVRFGVELEVSSVDVKVKLWGSGVGDTDANGQVLWILAQLKGRSYHDDDDGVQTYNNREAGELKTACVRLHSARSLKLGAWMTSSPTTACHLVDEFIQSCSFVSSAAAVAPVLLFFFFLTDRHDCQHIPLQANTLF